MNEHPTPGQGFNSVILQIHQVLDIERKPRFPIYMVHLYVPS